MTEQTPRHRRPLDDIPHMQASEIRWNDVPAQHGLPAHRNAVVTTACGREKTTTLVTRRAEQVRCIDCKAAMSAPGTTQTTGEQDR